MIKRTNKRFEARICDSNQETLKNQHVSFNMITIDDMGDNYKPPKWFKIWSETVYQTQPPQWFKKWNEEKFEPLVKRIDNIVKVNNLKE